GGWLTVRYRLTFHPARARRLTARTATAAAYPEIRSRKPCGRGTRLGNDTTLLGRGGTAILAVAGGDAEAAAMMLSRRRVGGRTSSVASGSAATERDSRLVSSRQEAQASMWERAPSAS